MAFVLVQHLDPQHESQLSEILSRTTAMPVVTVTNGLRVEPNRVYVIPSNADMAIGGGVLTLTSRETAARHTPVDRFLRSLAQELEQRAIGVVLSGTGSDGTLGLRAIKVAGGVTLVQDERSAKHAGMPQSAAAIADFILPPVGIARELVRIASHSYVSQIGPREAAPDPRERENDVAAVLRVLRTATSIDFSQYKSPSVRRRIARRMLLQKIDGTEAYVRYLRETPGEAQALRDDLLIQVTGFFREPEGFEALRQKVFPRLVKERAAGEPIRIWAPGCATGEEAYSLVICLLELLGETDSDFPIQMFATDLSAAAVARARAGTFPESIENEVSPERLRRFFAKVDGRYRINKAIRDACVFAQQDLTRDPPFSKLDLISCCNVLIYLGAELQARIIPLLHYALKPTGFLKLGASESVGRFAHLFSIIDRKHRIYTRLPGPSGHLGFNLSAGDRVAAAARTPEREWSSNAPAIEEADRLILGRYAPAGVVVNAAMEIVQFRGKTGPYLEAMPGVASLNLFRMAREGLASPLRQALQRAARSGGPVKAEGLRVKANGAIREVGLEVIPIGPAGGPKGQYHLILFFEARHRPSEAVPPRSASEREPRPKTVLERRMAQLTKELADAHQERQAISEEHDATMEELRAATEEAQSSNEELQSTNEELETSKEELQAANEELTTVNDELKSRNVELGQLSSDLANFLTSTNVPIIMVGADLRIRRMTPITERALNLAPGDVGRPIGDLRLSVEVPALEALVTDVVETLVSQEREVTTRDGHWYSVRVRPYRTADSKIDGAVISFVDVDALKRGLEQARAIVETVREPLVVLDADFRVLSANRSFFEVFEVAAPEIEQRSLFDLGNGEWNRPRLRTMLEAVRTEGNLFEALEVEHDFERIGKRTMLVSARRMPLTPDSATLILLAIDDVTERSRVEHARAERLTQEQGVRAEVEAASVAKDKFLAILSHELRTPLNAMLGWTRMLRTQKLSEADAAHGLEVIERNVRQQVRLIEDLLDVSRIVSGRMRIEARPIAVAPIVHATVATMEPVAQAKGVVLSSAVDESAGQVQGDPARLQQIVENLLSNAIKFTAGGGHVDVRLARLEGAVEIRVRDTGIGIAAEDLPHVFSRFAAGHASTQRQGGMGLGLSIVRHLVELHGGSIHGDSAGLGHGATFTVTLPLSGERTIGQAEPVGRADMSLGRLPTLDGVRILVVDDEPDARELVRATLTQCGAEVTEVASVRAALEALEGARFDVLVSDIAMPDEDGYSLIRQVRSREAEGGGGIPALALTAYARIEDRMSAIDAGYQQHAIKPIEPAELAAAVATLAGRPDGRRLDSGQ
jgi:two-component system CheB/CheR fusion protein